MHEYAKLVYETLERLERWGFLDPAPWLDRYIEKLELVSSWLDYLDQLTPAALGKLISPAALLRSNVERDTPAPTVRPAPHIPEKYADIIQH